MVSNKENYYKHPKLCVYCNKIIPYEHRHNKFCNLSCSASYNNSHRKKKHYGTCINCNTPLKHKGKYCSNKCMGEYVSTLNYKNKIELWKLGKINSISSDGNVIGVIKTYLLKKYNYKCSICGWNEINPYTGKSPLEVHHVDGNWQNNTEDNLTILCPNCHSLTSNYKASNKGKGRQFRRNNKP